MSCNIIIQKNVGHFAEIIHWHPNGHLVGFHGGTPAPISLDLGDHQLCRGYLGFRTWGCKKVIQHDVNQGLVFLATNQGFGMASFSFVSSVPNHTYLVADAAHANGLGSEVKNGKGKRYLRLWELGLAFLYSYGTSMRRQQKLQRVKILDNQVCCNGAGKSLW